MIEKLKIVLADTYALYLKTQNYHWNVEGKDFFALHGVFEEQYEALADAVDEIAERVRMLGDKVDATFKAFDAIKTVSDADHSLDSNKMVQDLHDDHVALNRQLHTLLDDGVDIGTEELIEGRIVYHEKQIWMLASYLK
ncbi:MAG: DNA starvation/stationary phase protection protein [Pseudomonadota bacterium]